MPKWEINLKPSQSSLAVQRQYEQIAEPFGFSTDCTSPSVELPRKRDMIEKVPPPTPRNCGTSPPPPKRKS